MSRSTRSTTSPARPRRSTTSTIRCRRPRPACMAPSTCWASPSACGPRSSRPRPARSTAIPTVHPQPEGYWGNVNPIGPRSCYDEGKRCAETLFFDYRRQHKLRIKVARIFNTYGPRMHPNDGRVVSNFIVQALKGEDITIYGDGMQTRVVLLRRRPDRRLAAPDGPHAGRLHRPGQSRQSGRDADQQLAEKVIELVGGKSKLVQARPLPVDDPAAALPRHHAGARQAQVGAQGAARAGSRRRRSSISTACCAATRR